MESIVIKVKKQEYAIEEAYKSLRTNLQFCGEDKKVIAITSCTPNEGKSTVSLHLAISLADSGKKVLLLDADLRKSVLYGRTKLNRRVNGLSHYLSNQVSVEEIIYNTNVSNLNIVYAGPVPPNPTELLSALLFESLLRDLKGKYDYILIDTPPLGNVIDSAIIAQKCDGVIFVIESGVISYRFAQEVKSQLEKSNCPILGVVLNKVDISKRGYGKYGQYEKYKSYEE